MKETIKNSIHNAYTIKEVGAQTTIALKIKEEMLKSPQYKDLPEKEFYDILNSKVQITFNEKKANVEEKPVEDLLSKYPPNKLIDYHLKKVNPSEIETYLLIYSYIELEDENKKLKLTDKQYKNWLETSSNQYITTKQFEILYGLSSRQQKSLRNKINDELPSFKLTDTSNILYNRLDVEKWLENYTGKINI